MTAFFSKGLTLIVSARTCLPCTSYHYFSLFLQRRPLSFYISSFPQTYSPPKLSECLRLIVPKLCTLAYWCTGALPDLVLHTWKKCIQKKQRKKNENCFNHLTNWLILTAYQPVRDYFMSRGTGICVYCAVIFISIVFFLLFFFSFCFIFIFFFFFFATYHINSHGQFNAKVIFVKEQLWYYLIFCSGGWCKVFIRFPKGISPKVNAIAPLELELV